MEKTLDPSSSLDEVEDVVSDTVVVDSNRFVVVVVDVDDYYTSVVNVALVDEENKFVAVDDEMD